MWYSFNKSLNVLPVCCSPKGANVCQVTIYVTSRDCDISKRLFDMITCRRSWRRSWHKWNQGTSTRATIKFGARPGILKGGQRPAASCVKRRQKRTIFRSFIVVTSLNRLKSIWTLICKSKLGYPTKACSFNQANSLNTLTISHAADCGINLRCLPIDPT